MGIVGRLVAGKSLYLPLEKPVLGHCPAYGKVSSPPDRTTDALVQLSEVLTSHLVVSRLVTAAGLLTRDYVRDQGVDVNTDPVTETIVRAGQRGGLVALLEDQLPIGRPGKVYFEHAKLYAVTRHIVTVNDDSGREWAGFAFDVMHYCYRTFTDVEEFFGPNQTRDTQPIRQRLPQFLRAQFANK
jgi:hypothetical protein